MKNFKIDCGDTAQLNGYLREILFLPCWGRGEAAHSPNLSVPQLSENTLSGSLRLSKVVNHSYDRLDEAYLLSET